MTEFTPEIGDLVYVIITREMRASAPGVARGITWVVGRYAGDHDREFGWVMVAHPLRLNVYQLRFRKCCIKHVPKEGVRLV